MNNHVTCPNCGYFTSIPNRVRVRIDGVETTLAYNCFSGARGHQYLTPGNAGSHAFPERLGQGQFSVGARFRTSGHLYEVLGPEH